MAGSTMQVNIVAADHPVWHGTAKSVTIPASEGGMGILPDHEPVLTVIKEGTIVVVDPEGNRLSFDSILLTACLLRLQQLHMIAIDAVAADRPFFFSKTVLIKKDCIYHRFGAYGNHGRVVPRANYCC